jgi:hypothetical protein
MQFDADQDSDALSAHIERNSIPTPNPYPAGGLYANTLFFAPSEGISVDITGTASLDSTFKRFDVIECAFLTRPGIMERTRKGRTRYAAPSLFAGSHGACYVVADDFSPAVPAGDGEEKKLVRSLKQTLLTVDEPGNWQLALALTVAIWRDDDVEPEIRVFWRDPESEVGGSGTVKE